jgi:hypothetical protein
MYKIERATGLVLFVVSNNMHATKSKMASNLPPLMPRVTRSICVEGEQKVDDSPAAARELLGDAMSLLRLLLLRLSSV